MKRILLINPPMCVNQPPTFVSFGIAYIAQELKKRHDVNILDIDGNRFSKEEVKRLIKESDSDLIAIGGLVTVYPYLHWLIPEIKKLKPGVEIVLGGPVASSLREACFKKFDIDYVVIGEGEITVKELLDEIEGDRKFASVKGIGYRRDGKIYFTKNRPLMESLDNVPIIDYSPFPIERLLENSGGTLQVHTQRGCPGNCTFCFNAFRVVSNRVRYRPVKNVVEEIELFNKKYKVELFALAGECVMLNKKWIIDFCKEVLKRKLKIKYRVTSRVDTVDKERLKWLKKSGCIAMSLGLETGSEKIMKIIQKNATVEQGKKAALLAKKYINRMDIGIILGYIGEDENTIRETVKFCKEIGVRPTMFYAMPYPGTALYRMGIEKGRIKEEEFLMGIDNSNILDCSINLTDMSDEKMKRLTGNAIRQIDRYYVFKDLMNLKLLKSTILYFSKNGLSSTVKRIKERMGFTKEAS